MTSFSAQTFTPINENYLVELLPREERSAGGIFMPEISQEFALKGVVRALPIKPRKEGEAAPVIVLDGDAVRVGMTVLFPAMRGTRFQHGGKDWLVLRQCDLVGLEESE